MAECLFCKIAQREAPSKMVYEDDEVVAFWDINPVAPVHILIIPRKHIPSVAHLKEIDAQLVGKLILVAQKVAQDQGIRDSGFRLIFNTGPNSGQIVDHIHLHLIGGKHLGHKLAE